MARTKYTLILTSVANQIFNSEGITSQGIVRKWYDDRGWYSTVIDFQSRPGVLGVILVVGIHFHWYAQDFISLDMGKIESDFIYFYNEDDFTKEAEGLVHIALSRAMYYRQALSDFDTGEKLLAEYPFDESNLWGYYHKGIMYGLTGDSAKSKKYFEQLISSSHDSPWANELKTRTKELLLITPNVSHFKQHIQTVISKSRKLKNLRHYENTSLWD